MLSEITFSIRRFLCKLHGLTDDHNYVPMLHILFSDVDQPTISEQEVVNLLWSLLEDIQSSLESSSLFPKRMKNWMDTVRPSCSKSTQTNNDMDFNDSKLVQITCTKQELDHRIESFIKRKRIESDAFNRHEFCKTREQTFTQTKTTSCARTDAIHVRRQSEKSLVQIKRVYNYAQTQVKKDLEFNKIKQWPPLHPSSTLPFYSLPPDLKERVTNLRSFLSPIKSANENIDVYKSIQNMEKRLLYLETLSPEYFNSGRKKHQNKMRDSSSGKPNENLSPQKENYASDDNSTMLLDARILELKEKLRKKMKRKAVT